MAVTTAVVALIVLFAIYVIRQQRYAARLPPGPRRLPLIGNLHQAPSGAVWVTFQKWIEQYGPLVSLVSDADDMRDYY
jgi:hypothetical protein